MLQYIYIVLFALSFAMLVFLISSVGKKLPAYYAMLFTCVLISNFGYLQLSQARAAQMAVFANQIVYLGCSFSPYFLLMCLADLCKVSIHKYFRYLLVAFGGAIFILASTTDRYHLYYKSVSLIHTNGFSILQKEYGPLHTLYPLYLALVMILFLVFILRAFRRKKDISYISCTLLLIAMAIMTGVYTAEKLLHLRFELLPVAYVFCQAVLLFLLRRFSLYNVTAVSTASMVKAMDHGFVLFDSNGRFLGSDEAAKHWFPEVRELPIDRVISPAGSDFLLQLLQWLSDISSKAPVYFEREDRIIEAQHSVIRHGKKKSIHCIYLRDDTQQQQYTRLVEHYNEDLSRDVNAKTEKIRQIKDDIIFSMANIVENRDSNTGGHITRTSDVMKIFVHHLFDTGKYPELTEDTAKCIINAAPLHDFGKIGVPDAVLNKPGKFTEEEFRQMQEHSAKGAVIVNRILQNSDDPLFRSIAVNVAHYHHEKWNGLGYPTGIGGTDIPFEARAMALADVFDALVSKRVYKEKYSYDKAFSIIEDSCGSHFDPSLCKEFLLCRPQLEALYNSYSDI